MAENSRSAMAATALLYLGPLLAGLAGYGWWLVAAFAPIFVLWLMVMRPRLWPGNARSWRQGRIWLGIAAQVAVQVLLIVLCFGIGRGIGGVAGVVPMLSPLFPLSVSLLSVPLSRLIWMREKPGALEAFLGEASARSRPVPPQPAMPPEAAGRLAGAVQAVLDLPADTPDADAGAAVARLVEATRDLPESGLKRLVQQLDAGDEAHGAARRALVLWGTDAAVLAGPLRPSALRAAFAVTWPDIRLLQLYAGRALRLIGERPEAWADFPEVAEIRYSIEDVNPPEVNALLSELADRIEAAMPASARGAI